MTENDEVYEESNTLIVSVARDLVPKITVNDKGNAFYKELRTLNISPKS